MSVTQNGGEWLCHETIITILIYSGSRNSLDNAVIVLEPIVIYGNADLIMSMDCRSPLMDHDSPQDI